MERATVFTSELRKFRFLFLDQTIAKSLIEIQKRIEDAFDNMTAEDLLFFGEDLSDWLESIQRKGSYLMVRSSGIEDGEDCVNAGGNISESYVFPQEKDLFMACGKVVASYFAFSSLKNQIAAGKNPFSSEPVLSVLLQELIGEPVGGSSEADQIPVSLVLFTREPNESEENFPVMKISSAFGHGTGVVNSVDVTNDTVHVVRSRLISDQFLEAYQNQSKKTRLAPIRNASTDLIELELVTNPLALQEERTLTPSLVNRLASLAEFIEAAFENRAMDVEIVVKNNVIYVVQARAIIRPESNPTFLSDELIKDYSGSALEMSYAKVLVAGRGSVELLEDPKQLLLCSSLSEAEGKYIPGLHKVIIVGKDEPANSHPVVNFSSLGVLCLYSRSFSEISTSYPLIVCPQSGRLCGWDTKIVAPQDCIKDGYYHHPAILGFSFNKEPSLPRFLPSETSTTLSTEIKEAIRSLQEATTTEVAQKALARLKTSLVGGREISYSAELPILQDTAKIIALFDSKIRRTLEEIEVAWVEDAPRLEKLFHIKTLSTLLSKQPKDAVCAYSLLDILELRKQITSMQNYVNRLSSSLQPGWIELLSAKEHSISLEGQNLWEQFLLELEKLPSSAEASQQKIQFTQFMDRVFQCGALPVFMNLICLPLLEERNQWTLGNLFYKKSASQVIKELANSITAEDQTLLEFLDEKGKEVENTRKNIFIFADPKTFDVAKDDLFKLLTFFSDKEKFIFPFRNSSNLTKILIAGLLKNLVEVTDNAIKTMKGSPLFTVNEKLEHLHEMLQVNFMVLKTWAEEFVPSEQLFDRSESSHLDRMKKDFERIKLKDPKSLLPSEKFSVQAAMLGSACNYGGGAPESLEDMFTLIHQNQIFSIAAINHKVLPVNFQSHAFLPPLLKTALQEFANPYYLGREGRDYTLSKLTGVIPTELGISYHYSIPLDGHGAGYELEYKKDGTFTFHGKFVGWHNWDNIESFVKILNDLQELKLIDPINRNDSELAFSWILQDVHDISMARKIFGAFMRSTFSPDDDFENLWFIDTASDFKNLCSIVYANGKLGAGGRQFYENVFNKMTWGN